MGEGSGKRCSLHVRRDSVDIENIFKKCALIELHVFDCGIKQCISINHLVKSPS